MACRPLYQHTHTGVSEGEEREERGQKPTPQSSCPMTRPPTTSHTLQDLKTDKKHLCTMVIERLFMITQKQKKYKYPSCDKWINNTWSIRTMEYYSILFSWKKNGELIICDNMMSLENIMLSKRSQTKKDKYLNDSIFMWFLQQANSWRQKVKQVTRGWGEGKWEVSVGRYII